MTGLEAITQQILADAKERARTILETAQSDCRKMAEDYAARADAIRDEIEERAIAEGEDLIARAKSAAAMTRRNILLQARGELLNEAFEAAKKEICDTDYGKYRELLVALLSCALLEQAKSESESEALGDETLTPDAYEVLLSAADRERFGNAVVEGAKRVCSRRIGAERAAKLCLSDKTADIDGGLILRCGNIEANCSISVLLAEMRRRMEAKISAILFD